MRFINENIFGPHHAPQRHDPTPGCLLHWPTAFHEILGAIFAANTLQPSGSYPRDRNVKFSPLVRRHEPGGLAGNGSRILAEWLPPSNLLRRRRLSSGSATPRPATSPRAIKLIRRRHVPSNSPPAKSPVTNWLASSLLGNSCRSMRDHPPAQSSSARQNPRASGLNLMTDRAKLSPDGLIRSTSSPAIPSPSLPKTNPAMCGALRLLQTGRAVDKLDISQRQGPAPHGQPLTISTAPSSV